MNESPISNWSYLHVFSQTFCTHLCFDIVCTYFWYYLHALLLIRKSPTPQSEEGRLHSFHDKATPQNESTRAKHISLWLQENHKADLSIPDFVMGRMRMHRLEPEIIATCNLILKTAEPSWDACHFSHNNWCYNNLALKWAQLISSLKDLLWRQFCCCIKLIEMLDWCHIEKLGRLSEKAL